MNSIIPTTADAPVVLEERFEVSPASDESRVQVSEQPLFTRGQFNTLRNPITREVTVSAPVLTFNGSIRTLEALRITRDVTRITLIADEVRIEQALQWKGAAVDIHARRLVFRRNGRIETTPESYAGAAFTESRDDDGRPLDESGSIRAADGRDGEAGGDIRLFVAEVDWGDGGIARLVTDGSPGELGEKGGTLPFVSRKNGPPTKDLTDTITRAQVRKLFEDASHSTKQLNNEKHWKTEGGVGSEGLDTTWGYVTGDAISRNEVIPYGEHTVTDVRVGLAFQKGLDWVYNEVRAPLRSGPTGWQVVPGVSLLIDKAWQKTGEIEDPWTPSNGEDAFPSGTTGRGGAAGSLSVPAHVQVPDRAFSGAGGASKLSAEVPGGAAGTPQKYLCVAFNASQFAPNPLDPKKSLTNLLMKLEHTRVRGETKPGKSAEGSARGAGEQGRRTVLDDAQGWMEPRLLRMVADHARELYHAGQRQRAWELLEPYWRASREATSQAARASDARSSLRAISNLVENYQQNLDVYGNPPGWVPRFSSSSYLQTYLADRQFSYRFVGMMEQATRLMDSLEHAAAMLDGLAASGEEAIDRVRDELFASFIRYDSASRSLEESRAVLERAQQRLSALESDASHRAAIELHDKAAVKAVFDVSAAILKAVPAYQPMLAGVGTVMESVGTVVVDGMGTGGSVNGWSALEKISGSVATTLKENAGSFRSQLQDDLKEKYKDQLNPDDVDLRTSVEKLRTQIATGQEDFDRAILTAQEEVAGNKEVSDLLSADLGIAERLVGQARHRDEVLAELRNLNSTLEGLGAPSGNGVGADAAARARQRLLVARAKLYTVLANTQNEIRDLEREAAADEKRRGELNARRAVVTAHREELEAKQAKLKKLLPDFEKLEANTRMKKA
ncbi:MAG TPA: hypothetical protein VK928_01640, partial [Longimicrobiales bacterium]|nr:hypothetical protein [Longimicrobiales bacterium]